GTTCDVTGSGPGTLATPATDFPYSCHLASLPQGELDNTATVSWGDQDLSTGHLAAGSAPFTFSNILFDVTPVNDCVNVTDDVVGVSLTPSQFCGSGTATGSRTVHVGDLTGGTCNTIDNTATITETGQQSNDAQTQICVPVDLHVTKNATPGFTRTFKWRIAKSATPT